MKKNIKFCRIFVAAEQKIIAVNILQNVHLRGLQPLTFHAKK